MILISLNRKVKIKVQRLQGKCHINQLQLQIKNPKTFKRKVNFKQQKHQRILGQHPQEKNLVHYSCKA